eukprot:399382-Amphidinium_carterae.1
MFKHAQTPRGRLKMGNLYCQRRNPPAMSSRCPSAPPRGARPEAPPQDAALQLEVLSSVQNAS